MKKNLKFKKGVKFRNHLDSENHRMYRFLFKDRDYQSYIITVWNDEDVSVSSWIINEREYVDSCYWIVVPDWACVRSEKAIKFDWKHVTECRYLGWKRYDEKS